MTDHFGWVPRSPEVDALEAEVGGREGFVAGRDAQDGAVVADAETDCRAALCAGANPLDDRLFVERHPGSNI